MSSPPLSREGAGKWFAARIVNRIDLASVWLFRACLNDQESSKAYGGFGGLGSATPLAAGVLVMRSVACL